MNVHFAGFTAKGLVYLSDAQAAELANATVQPNDVFLDITGASIGRCTTAPPEMAGARVNQHVMIIRPTDELLPRFLSTFLASPLIQRMINDIEVGATRQALTKGMIERFDIPLPPLAEQKRIVAKVDELMALCDRLEAQQQERQARHAALARASLARFAEAPTPANLEFLFHKSYSISPADLRKAILTLAVQGRLVPRGGNESPARECIRIARAKAELPAYRPRPDEWSDQPFELPASWVWVTVSDVAESRLGKMLDEEKNRGDPHPYLRNTNVHWFRFELDRIKTMRLDPAELDNFRVRPGDVLICEGGHGIARSAVWAGQVPGMTFQKALHRVRPLSCLCGHFLTYCLRVYEDAGVLQRYYTGAGIPQFTGKS